VTPNGNDGRAVHRLTVTDVPVEGFWSISVYDAEGHLVKNDRDAYTLNSVTAKRAPDGSVTVQFGGCEDQVATACRSFPAGTTWCGCTARGPRSWTAPGPSPKRRRLPDLAASSG
jgi:hypothetical protein